VFNFITAAQRKLRFIGDICKKTGAVAEEKKKAHYPVDAYTLEDF